DPGRTPRSAGPARRSPDQPRCSGRTGAPDRPEGHYGGVSEESYRTTPSTVDLLVTGGVVLRRPRPPPRVADRPGPGAAVAGGRVAAVGAGVTGAARTVDATGMLVCPGFVDVHTHSDLSLLSAPAAPSRVHQGITTEVVGNCGLGVAPLTGGTDRAAL